MTVIATNTVRPHIGKAKLQLNNMLEVTKAFGDMGITARVSRVVFGQNAGCLVFSTFASNFEATVVGELHSGWMTVLADN